VARWSVHVIGGKRTECLGTVTAPNERKALVEAIKVFEVSPNWRTRLIVAPVVERRGWFQSLRKRGRG
jgi:hypothetical protein